MQRLVLDKPLPRIENPVATVVGYGRVSTDDKGQDVRRQDDILRGWSLGNRVQLAAIVHDEGTSGEVTPLSRPKVREAIAIAKEQGCGGLVVETSDRWTRGGLEDGVLSRAALAQEHRLKLYLCDVPFAWDRMMQDMIMSIRDIMSADWLARHKARVAQGLRRAMEKGWPHGKPGRPPKEPLNLEEQTMLKAWREQRVGWATIALEISRHRGAFEVADTKLQRERKVSSPWIRERAQELGLYISANATISFGHGASCSEADGSNQDESSTAKRGA